MSDPMTHIVVAGGAEVSRENVEDLLKDFLLIDTKDEKQFRFFLPADGGYIGDAVVHTAAFLNDLGESYTAVKGHTSPKAKQLARRADDVLAPESDGDMAQYLINILKGAKADGDEVFLLLAWGDGEEAPDDVTEELLDLAAEAEIPIKDLTAGLDDLGFDDESESAEDAEEPVDEERSKPEKPVRELKENERELPVDEAQSDLPGQIEGQAEEFPDLVTVLSFMAQKLDFEDRMNAAKNMSTLRRSPLTEAVRHHLHELMDGTAQAVEETGELQVQQPLPESEEETPRPRRGKARDTASDLVKVYVHEGNKTVRLVPGRGRPKKGEESQEMTRGGYQEMLDSGDYTPF
ncbi:hypothetical protein [Nonomuraea typhae]|uniref:Uncharacterized protein n=1 Tax=Nonomuraea typhae TaxID=2603600 RepID=A0ABW7YJ43_9ACTN